jgi:diguanylate cyclase (GGDEF)-like protein
MNGRIAPMAKVVTDKDNRWESLYRASQEMNASLDLEELYAAIHNVVEKVMPCEDFVIDGYDDATSEIVPLYLIEPPRLRAYPPRYFADHGLAGAIIQAGKPILLSDSEAMTASGIRFEMYGSQCMSRSLVAVPMQLHGKVIGMLSVQSHTENAYTVEDQELLEMLASHAAIALENANLFQQIKRLADADPLTGILNRRRLFELADLEFARAQRYSYPLTAVMIDVDHFREFNNRHGHKAGDWILKIIVESCRRQIRNVDIFGRYGGEEFTLILPSTGLQGAVQVAERLRNEVEQAHNGVGRTYFKQMDTASLKTAATQRVTISLGVAVLDSSCENVEMLIDHADQAMYQAKRAGRNRVKAWADAEAVNH